MVILRISWPFALTMLTAISLCAQPPAIPPAPPDRTAEVQRKLQMLTPIDSTARRAVAYARTFLASAAKAKRAGEPFQADRLTDAADAMVHVAEHQEHLRNGGGPKARPPADTITDHLHHVYFRVQQADYFLRQSADPQAASLTKWAREFYQLAVNGYERKDQVAADENAKCAEDVVKCLEDLAQAATATGPVPPPPPPPPPPKGPPR